MKTHRTVACLLFALVPAMACIVESEDLPDEEFGDEIEERDAVAPEGFHCMGTIVCECADTAVDGVVITWVEEEYNCEAIADGNNWCEVPHCSVLCESKGTLISNGCYPAT